MAAPDANARAKAEARVGQTLSGKWRIDRVLDLGGMAAVFAATHRNGKRVAIKMLHPLIATNASLRERFLREGYVANKIEHRGAVQILDDDISEDGAAFLVMELLEGESLEQRMGRAHEGRVPVHEVLGVADQVLDALAAFHAQGVVHRDIKPGNLFITRDGIVKVLDFGLARLRDASAGAAPTGMGTVLGTISYMPPEQAQGKTDEIDARSDVFALGAVMFRAITGKGFVKGESAVERLQSSMTDRAPGLATCDPDIPSYVCEVVDTALAFNKSGRWTDAHAMRVAVRAAYQALVADAKQRSQPISKGKPASGPPPTVTASITGSETIYREALEPSVLVEVSFGGVPVVA
jgi:serine/threonine protein kinase